jgi:integrase
MCFAKEREALQWSAKTELDMREGRWSKAEKAKAHTVAEVIDRYLAEVLPVKSDRVRFKKMQAAQLKWWRAKIGDCTLSNLTPSVISEARGKLLTEGRRKRTPSTVNRYVAALSHALSTAKRQWEWLADNPISNVQKFKEPRGRLRFLSDAERDRLMTACKEERSKPLHLIVVLAISTGARKNELLTLKWDDVDMDRHRITVQETKNGERRPLFLSGLALLLIASHADAYRRRGGYVFPAHGGKHPVDIEVEFRRAMKRAGIQDFRFHDLRHTAASYMAMNGASLTEIGEILGHKTATVTKRYAHLTTQHSADVVARMNEKIFKQAEEVTA